MYVSTISNGRIKTIGKLGGHFRYLLDGTVNVRPNTKASSIPQERNPSPSKQAMPKVGYVPKALGSQENIRGMPVARVQGAG